MPALSPTMEEGTLAKWHVREGDAVQTGDVIAEIETDKATMEVEAIDDGTMGKLLVPEGTEHIPVNKPIALLLTDGEDADADAAESFTSPRRGEVASRSDAGEGARTPPDSFSPSPQPSPQRGEGEKEAPSDPFSAKEPAPDFGETEPEVEEAPAGPQIAPE